MRAGWKVTRAPAVAQESEEVAFAGRVKSREFASEKEKRGQGVPGWPAWVGLGGNVISETPFKNFHDSGAIESCCPHDLQEGLL